MALEGTGAANFIAEHFREIDIASVMISRATHIKRYANTMGNKVSHADSPVMLLTADCAEIPRTLTNIAQECSRDLNILNNKLDIAQQCPIDHYIQRSKLVSKKCTGYTMETWPSGWHEMPIESDPLCFSPWKGYSYKIRIPGY